MASFYSLRAAYSKLLLSSMEPKRDITAIESVQRKFSKKILGLNNLSYSDRLHHLHALSLTNRRTLTDLVTSFKCLNGLLDRDSSDVGFALASTSTRGQDMRLFRRHHINAVAANRFSHRAATTWDNLPFDCLKNNSLKIFKKTVLNQLCKQQCEI